ncbi:MAG: hypothetical protein JJLCMIEE_03077 [Acidimicrobiales bacterium]|nr:MAG: hypothetical protein EDR02_08005 [Actinomycetota bacterium]MBV6509959.1 hypothetical protein [Acidimicrobiales bacterium]RIK08553.1 MAG: hypothetical protein DCC48_01000 [Acidobacteriota bacterium]
MESPGPGTEAAAAPEPIIAVLEQVWAALDALGQQLGEEQWKTPTDCPGWTVQDNLAHIAGRELALLGLR